jgi:hypothetical protein
MFITYYIYSLWIYIGLDQEKCEDLTKEVIRTRKPKKDRQHNGQKKKDRQHNGQKKKEKRTNNDPQETKDRVMVTPLKSWVNSYAPEG